MTAQQAPHHPKGARNREVLAALSAPGVESEGAEPLVDGDGHGGDIERGENRDPELGAERLEEGQKRDVRAQLRRG